MKRVIHSLLFSAISLVLSLSLIACNLTAFSVKDADYAALFRYCASAVAVFSAFSILIKNKRVFAAASLSTTALYLIVLVIIRQQLKLSAINYLNIVLAKLHSAYPWIHTLKTESYDKNIFIICIAILISGAITVSLLRFRRALPAAIVSMAALMPCYLVRNTPPGTVPLTICAVILLTLFTVRFFHSKNISLTPAVAIPAAAILTAAALMIQALSSEPADWLKRQADRLPGLGGNYAADNTGIDFSKSVDLNEMDNLTLDDTPEVKVNTDINSGELYLKDSSYSLFGDNVWTQSGDESSWSTYDPQDYLGSPGLIDPTGYSYVTVNSLAKRDNALFPYKIMADDSFNAGFTVNRDINISPTDDNKAESDFTVVTDSGSGGTDYYGYAAAMYTQVPEGILDVTEKDENLKKIKGVSDTYAAVKAEAVADYFERLDGKYVTSVGKIPKNTDYMTWFTRQRKGWCIHYATAAVLVLRQMGLPARYVTGYKTQFAEDGSDKIGKTLTQQNRHAWAEYYDEYEGWTPLDVTPGSVEEQTEPPTETKASDQTATEVTTEPTAAPQEPTSVSPTEPSAGSDEQKQTGKTGQKGIDLSFLIPYLIALLSIAAVIALIILRRRLICSRRERLLGQQNRNDAVIAAYRYLQRLKKLQSGHLPGDITAVAEKAAYSRKGVTAEDQRKVSDYLNRTLGELNESSGRLKQLYYKYILCVY